MTIQKKLIYSSWHRGMREVDLILGPFAGIYVPDYSPLQLEQYEAILNATDQDLLDWIYKRKALPPEYNNPVMQQVIAFANREEEAEDSKPVEFNTTLKTN